MPFVIIWDHWNLEHLRDNHRASVDEYEQILQGAPGRPSRVKIQEPPRGFSWAFPRFKHIGQTRDGRFLVVIAERKPAGERPITCWPASQQVIQRYLAWRQTTMKNRTQQSPMMPQPRKIFPTTGTREAYFAEVAYWQRHRHDTASDWKGGLGSGAMVDGIFIPDSALKRGKRNPLRDARLARGLTQAALADLSGVPATAISAVENGRIAMGLARAKKLGAALGVSFHALLAAASPTR
jgi:DNA-binding XRE family transcriptional regulator